MSYSTMIQDYIVPKNRIEWNMSDQQHIFKSGDKFSNYYEIDSFLEKSHSSAVYTARNTRMNHPVTIRVFSTQLDSEEELEVFEQQYKKM